MRYVGSAMGFVALLLSAADPSMASAETLFVANNGVDSASCGERTQPCRSISAAVDLALAGDRILVGPGVYGDLNADGDFDDDGEENAEQGFGCECMINLPEPIKLESTDGASSTVIDVGFPIAGQLIGVYISADNVSFGSRNRGFHVTSRELATAAASGSPRALAGVAVDDQATHARIRGNLITKAVDGFVVSGAGAELRDNTAANSARNGFLITGEGHLIRDNTSINNIGAGFGIIGSDHAIVRNSVIGNRTCGITFNSGELDTPSVIVENNIFGNGTLVPALDNCGLSNTSFQPLRATENFWGWDTCPGPDPPDEVLGSLENTTVFPVAQKPFPVRGF